MDIHTGEGLVGAPWQWSAPCGGLGASCAGMGAWRSGASAKADMPEERGTWTMRWVMACGSPWRGMTEGLHGGGIRQKVKIHISGNGSWQRYAAMIGCKARKRQLRDVYIDRILFLEVGNKYGGEWPLVAAGG